MPSAITRQTNFFALPGCKESVMRSVKVYEEAWPLHTPFVISRGSRSEACVVVVENRRRRG
ncbi:mandelate racemase/muconate lactonizing protein [Enterobacter cloacae]|uniref:Mandelate racemase/muconate lactonizing protein n=1 Tax=Enterobacter cloacae TaxID=550 RepID=A0A377LZX8_ENTCL|nr:mandelate racemase/muconate lactonizing protein [Enterobacter cloacae]